MKSATLELIAKANGKKTGDELVKEYSAARKQAMAEEQRLIVEQKVAGTFMNSKERRRWRLMLEKAAKMETPNYK